MYGNKCSGHFITYCTYTGNMN